MSDHWPHFEDSHPVKLEKQLSGTALCFEDTYHFRGFVNWAKSVKPVNMMFLLNRHFSVQQYTRETRLEAAT